MMTIKHVSSMGNELLYETPEVSFTRGDNATPATVWYKRDNELVPLTGGRVFVMNGHGSTVSRYDLDFDPRGFRPNTPDTPVPPREWLRDDDPKKLRV